MKLYQELRELCEVIRDLTKTLKRCFPDQRQGILIGVVEGKARTMSQGMRPGQSCLITAQFFNSRATPPTNLPMPNLPTFANPDGKLVLVPTASDAVGQSSFSCVATLADGAQPGDVGVVTCHGEGDTNVGDDPIDLAPFSITVLAPDDNTGTLTGVVSG